MFLKKISWIFKPLDIASEQDHKRALFKSLGFAIVLAGVLLVLMNRPEAAPDFTAYDAGDSRKAAFFDYMLPLIHEANEDILTTRSELLEIRQDAGKLSWLERRRLRSLGAEYEIENFDPDNEDHWATLLRKVDIVPPSLALAQAANESAWGTSRFAEQGNNFFGHWCYVEGCGIVPSDRPEGASHEVAAFDSPQQSVERYVFNLNHHPAYQEFRRMRAALRATGQDLTGTALVEGLDNYSERGEEYIADMESMIRFNSLSPLDTSPAGD